MGWDRLFQIEVERVNWTGGKARAGIGAGGGGGVMPVTLVITSRKRKNLGRKLSAFTYRHIIVVACYVGLIFFRRRC